MTKWQKVNFDAIIIGSGQAYIEGSRRYGAVAGLKIQQQFFEKLTVLPLISRSTNYHDAPDLLLTHSGSSHIRAHVECYCSSCLAL